jgi:hypothetical protein
LIDTKTLQEIANWQYPGVSTVEILNEKDDTRLITTENGVQLQKFIQGGKNVPY